MKHAARPSPDQAIAQLRSALTITRAGRMRFSPGPATQDEIITTARFILVLQGALAYTIDGKTMRMKEGAQFLVPAWSRRVWSAVSGDPAEITWCEFDEEDGAMGENRLFLRQLAPPEFSNEARAFRRLIKLSRTPEPSVWTALEMEAEVKTMLVRFWRAAIAATGRPATGPDITFHPRVRAMLRWLENHQAEADVLPRLYAQAGMSRDYFRILFTRAVKCSPHDYVERLRLRRARHLLHSTDWQLKRIAAEVGYPDPLYFSRLYHRFWKHPPSAERNT